MAFPNDPIPPQDLLVTEFQRLALRYLQAITQGSSVVAPSAVAGNTSGAVVVALPPYVTTCAAGTPLTTDGQEIEVPATALCVYISNTSETEKIFIRYGAGATTGNYNRFVAPGGEVAIYDFKGTISIAGTAISGQASVV